jgi:hypothetical protein
VSRFRIVAALAVAAILATAACTGLTSSSQDSSPPASATATAVAIPSIAPGGAPTLAQAIAKLCVSGTPPSGTPAAGTLPPELASIAHQVEVARGHDYVTPPAAEAISSQEMDRRLQESFAAYYPKDLYDRRTVAWRTIGVIPQNADLHEAYRTFLTGEVVGFYDPETGELVYQGSENPSFIERLTLAHELTHALDDQIFDLKRLDAMTNSCQDERSAAALGLVEGSAQYFSAATAAENPDISLPDLLQAIAESLAGASAPPGVPPFVYAISTWPYSAGMAFVGTLEGEGGTAKVDKAFEQFPVSTEQVIHPDRFPTDAPTPVDIPDLTGALGETWGDLDAMTIGEEWLRARMPTTRPPGGTGAPTERSPTAPTWSWSCGPRGIPRATLRPLRRRSRPGPRIRRLARWSRGTAQRSRPCSRRLRTRSQRRRRPSPRGSPAAPVVTPGGSTSRDRSSRAWPSSARASP